MFMFVFKGYFSIGIEENKHTFLNWNNLYDVWKNTTYQYTELFKVCISFKYEHIVKKKRKENTRYNEKTSMLSTV